MKTKKSIAGMGVLILASLFTLVACNNSEYTKSPATGTESAPASSDTTMNSTPSSADTSMNKYPMRKDTLSNSPGAAKTHMASPTRKGKITVGNMNTKKTALMRPDKDGIYEMTEVRPTYPGGHEALDNYINEHVEYPQTAIDDHSQGTVNVQFVVDENGNVSNAKVIGKRLENGLDQEAVKVVSNMPKWTPGKMRGKNVKTRVVLPITYKLEE